MHSLKPLLLPLLFAACFFIVPQSHAEDYLDQLINNARANKIAQSRQWEALLHYQTRFPMSGKKSSVDDAKFFLSPDGKYSLEAELEATLRAFFEPNIDESSHAQCRFPARFAWLGKELSFEANKIPKVDCSAFNEWYEALSPRGLTLIFPASFLNNPASAFGHTLLRIDRQENGKDNSLLSYSANYAADTRSEDALSYAFKGIFGGYSGYFGIMPYYEKVREYSDIENRDIWEYKLKVTQSEVDLLVFHLYELRGVSSDYYYFDENCSYQLLSLLDVAWPDAELTEQFFGRAIPVDTVSSVIGLSGRFDSATYRPSQASLLRRKTDYMNAQEISSARSLALGEVALGEESWRKNLSPQQQARILELAADFASYSLLAEKTERVQMEQRLLSLMLARSQMSSEPSLAIDEVIPIRPDLGHESFRLSFTEGQSDNQLFTDLGIRPAFHSLLDPWDGFEKGSQLEFLSTRLRYREPSGINLQEFKLLDIISLSPRDELIRPISWAVKASAARERVTLDESLLIPRLEVGFGRAWYLGQSLIYALGTGELEQSSAYGESISAGAGLRSGLMFELSRGLAGLLETEVIPHFLGEDYIRTKASSGLRIELNKDIALSLIFDRQDSAGGSREDMGLRLDFFL